MKSRANYSWPRLTYICFLSCLLSSVLAFAEPENPNLLPFGELEGLRGNTGTGGGGSTAAVYYNPAGLLQLAHPRIAVSGNTYSQYNLSSDSLAKLDDTDLPYSASAFNAVPSTIISTLSAGSWVLAYFLLVPDALKLDNKVSWTTPATKVTILENHDRSDLWFGGSAATALGEKWSLGFSLVGVNHHSTASASSVVISRAASNTMTSSLAHAQSSVSGLAIIAGVLYQPSDWCSFGFRIRSPLLLLSGSGTGYNTSQSVDAGILTSTETSQDSFSARYQLPLDMAFGTRFQILESWAVLADVSWQNGADYEAAPESEFSARVKLRPMARYNLGTEIVLASDTSLSVGFYYNPSSAENSALFNFYGVTTGVSLHWDKVRTGLGAFYSWANQTHGYSSSEVTTRLYGGLLSVGYLL